MGQELCFIPISCQFYLLDSSHRVFLIIIIEKHSLKHLLCFSGPHTSFRLFHFILRKLREVYEPLLTPSKDKETKAERGSVWSHADRRWCSKCLSLLHYFITSAAYTRYWNLESRGCEIRLWVCILVSPLPVWAYVSSYITTPCFYCFLSSFIL